MDRIPEAPTKQVVISSGDSQRLEEWVGFFRKLSPHRIEVIRPSDEKFFFLLASTQQAFRDEKMMPEEQTIVGWPTVETTAFVLCIDSSPLNREPQVKLEDTYFFCFDDRAFSPMRFGWDGDEENHASETFSLRGCSRRSLLWSRACSSIQIRVADLESRVPQLSK